MYVNSRPTAPTAVAPASAARILPVAIAAPRPRVHQVLAQLGQAPVSTGYEGINGFTVKDVAAIVKGMDVRGVPPRGRPV